MAITCLESAEEAALIALLLAEEDEIEIECDNRELLALTTSYISATYAILGIDKKIRVGDRLINIEELANLLRTRTSRHMLNILEAVDGRRSISDIMKITGRKGRKNLEKALKILEENRLIICSETSCARTIKGDIEVLVKRHRKKNHRHR